jgi:fructose-1,6-bisphosphatase/inositol monophosphatase family enzyme
VEFASSVFQGAGVEDAGVEGARVEGARVEGARVEGARDDCYVDGRTEAKKEDVALF